VRAGSVGSAIRAGVNVAMEASVAGGIPIHAVLREGISGDRVEVLYGILNGTSNFILTEMERRGESLETCSRGQRLGYAERTRAPTSTATTRAPSWRSCRRWPSASASRRRHYTEGIRRISQIDFQYATA